MSRLRSLPWAVLLFLAAAAGCDGEGGSPTGTDFGTTVVGIVASEGSALPGVRVLLNGAATSETFTGLNGLFAFEDVPAGSYTVSLASYPAGVDFPSLSQSIVVMEGADSVRADFHGTRRQDVTLRGRVSVGESGVQGLVVRAVGPDEVSASTDAHGEYQMEGLRRGTYTLRLSGYDPNAQSFPVAAQSVEAVHGGPVEVDFLGTAITPDPDGPNLTVPALYITQSVQDLDGSVPLVAGRDGVLRVFGISSRSIEEEVAVRVEFYVAGALVHVEVMPPPDRTTPTSIEEDRFDSSWNVPIAGSVIQPGLEVLAFMDFDQRVLESDEGDNWYPLSGQPLPLDVVTTPSFDVTFVPVRQNATGLTGEVNLANAPGYLDLAKRMLPIGGTTLEVHAEYTTDAPPLERLDGNDGWSTILGEIDALRLVEQEEGHRYYYGVVRIDYVGGTVGMSYVGRPTAMGWDRLPNAAKIAAHEWGHNWSLWHAPGCEATASDPAYPYESGQIGVWGLDVSTSSLKTPDGFFDFMGYCWPQWVSDYHYGKILQNRQILDGQLSRGPAEPGYLVWGRVLEDEVVLEPAFQVNASPSLPSREGALSLEALGEGEEVLYSSRFQPVPVPDRSAQEGHFAFVLPLRALGGREIHGLRVTGPGRLPALRTASDAPPLAASLEPGLRRVGESRMEIRWNVAAAPMAMIRDLHSGEVLSFARGGQVIVEPPSGEVEILFSDGVRTQNRIRWGGG